MEDDYNKQYKRIAAAEELIDTNSLLKQYVELYKRKYKTMPIFPVSNAHLTQIKDIRKQTGQNAYAIIDAYFKIHDDWFQKQNYSLDCLMKNLNKVNAFVARNAKQVDLRDKMHVELFCEACWATYYAAVAMNHSYDTTMICDKCKKENKPLKKVDKKDRFGTITRLGAAFPPMPE